MNNSFPWFTLRRGGPEGFPHRSPPGRDRRTRPGTGWGRDAGPPQLPAAPQRPPDRSRSRLSLSLSRLRRRGRSPAGSLTRPRTHGGTRWGARVSLAVSVCREGRGAGPAAPQQSPDEAHGHQCGGNGETPGRDEERWVGRGRWSSALRAGVRAAIASRRSRCPPVPAGLVCEIQ